MIYLSEREKGITKRLECDCWRGVWFVSTTKDEGDGTGLGLSKSYRIIEAYDGSIKVKNKGGAVLSL